MAKVNLSKNKAEDTIKLLIPCVIMIYNIIDINQGKEKPYFNKNIFGFIQLITMQSQSMSAT